MTLTEANCDVLGEMGALIYTPFEQLRDESKRVIIRDVELVDGFSTATKC